MRIDCTRILCYHKISKSDRQRKTHPESRRKPKRLLQENRKEVLHMKSILQLDRETQLDRQRRCSCGLHMQRIFRTVWHFWNRNAKRRNVKDPKKKYIFRQRCSKTFRRKCGKNCCDTTAFGRTMLTRISPTQSRQQHRKSSGRFSHCRWNSENQDTTHKRQAAASAFFCIF